VLGRMLGAMACRAGGREDRYTDEALGLALGRRHNGILSPFPQPVSSADGKRLVVLDGELYGLRPGETGPEFALAQFGLLAEAVGGALEGAYCLAAVDLEARRLVLLADKFGLKPLYYAPLPDGVAFAGEVKALLATGWVDREPDYRSFGEFFRFGHLLGQRTLIGGVHLLPPGGRLVCDLRTGSWRADSYWKPLSLFCKRGEHAPEVPDREVVDAFVEGTRRRLGDVEALGISLSGGLDSRAVLAAMGPEARGVHSYTLGVEGCRDQKLSARMARIAGTRHEFLALGGEYLSGFEAIATTMVRLSDGFYHPQESTEKLALDYFGRAPFRILLRGHGGELAKASLAHPVMVTRELLACRSTAQLLSFLSDRTNTILRNVEPSQVFAKPLLEAVQGARRSLEESVGEAAEGLEAPDVCVYYYLTEWIRRQVVASLEIFRSQVEVRLPYLDEGFLRLLFKLPVARRYGGELQVKVVSTCMPGLLKVPNSNTGAPLDASRARLFLADKLGALGRRLRLPGLRHYTEFLRWQREQFRADLERIVFDERTLGRGLYRPDGLRAAFDAHVSGVRNHARFFATVAGLELWHRHFVDAPPDVGAVSGMVSTAPDSTFAR
jgi:asparagine synthase (glutamine-hydrolysing)